MSEKHELPIRIDYAIDRRYLKYIQSNQKTLSCDVCKKHFNVSPEVGLVYSDVKFENYYICYECANQKNVEQLTYGLYLRFMKKHFIPCENCQKEVYNMLLTSDWRLNSDYPIELYIRQDSDYPIETYVRDETEKSVIVYLKFTNKKWMLCKACSMLIIDYIAKEELIIGNKDYVPPVELWSKWDFNEKLTDKINKSKP